METPESVYLVMYPSEDPAKEEFETFRPNWTFLEYASALWYISKIVKMIPSLSVREIYSGRVEEVSAKEISRYVMRIEMDSPFEKILKYAIVEMKLHGEFDFSYSISSGIQDNILHILDFDPRTQRPKTEYANIHSVHASLSSISDMVQKITDDSKIDWHRPFGHKTDHMYTPYEDKDGTTKYLVMSGSRML